MEETFIKYPIGIQDFVSIITDGYTYVDKTAIIYKMVKSGKCFFLSRPRRFGKSLTLSTLQAYFEGKRELFKGLAIEKLEKDWKKYPVFHLSFARFEKSREKSLEDIIEYYLQDWENQYHITDKRDHFENRFAAVIRKAVEITGEKAVILVDEYDSSLVTTLEDHKLHDHVKSILKPFFTVLKDLDSHIQFSFLTGITRFSKMNVFSGLNNLDDISLDVEYSEICGITPTELKQYFRPGIEKLGKEYELDYDGTVALLKQYYDGYHFTKKSADLYNPFSILNALSKSEISNYWFATGIPSFLVERMRSKDIDLEKYMNQRVSGETLKETDSAYSSDTAILFQAGFLTIKDYVKEDFTYILGIPNREVKEGMSKLFLEKFLYPVREEGQNLINKLIDSLKKGDPESFLSLLKSFFSGVPFDLSKGDKEVYFHNAFYIVANLIGLRVHAEYHTSAGSIDLLISTDDYIYVIEIKLNKRSADALAQIDSKDYALQWTHDNRKLFKIGVSFSSRTRTISSWLIN